MVVFSISHVLSERQQSAAQPVQRAGQQVEQQPSQRLPSEQQAWGEQDWQEQDSWVAEDTESALETEEQFASGPSFPVPRFEGKVSSESPSLNRHAVSTSCCTSRIRLGRG